MLVVQLLAASKDLVYGCGDKVARILVLNLNHGVQRQRVALDHSIPVDGAAGRVNHNSRGFIEDIAEGNGLVDLAAARAHEGPVRERDVVRAHDVVQPKMSWPSEILRIRTVDGHTTPSPGRR